MEKSRLGAEGKMRAKALSAEAARSVALRSLIFLADDSERIERFLALTGIDPADLRALSREDAFLLALIDHLMQDEPLLLAFARGEGLAPEEIAAARVALGGEPPE